MCAMNRLNKTQYALLGLLSQEPMSGYDIKKTLKASTQHFWQESDGQIYPALAQLLKEKLITCTVDQSQGARIRKVYQITAKGLKTLKNWLIKAAEPPVPRNELLLKLFFGLHTPSEINLKHVLDHQQQLISRLKTYQEITKMLTHEKSPHLSYWKITLNYGKKITQAQLDWCEETLKTLKTLTLAHPLEFKKGKKY
jgi:PadR family transcriptional regulator, regulatory protein AphA